MFCNIKINAYLCSHHLTPKTRKGTKRMAAIIESKREHPHCEVLVFTKETEFATVVTDGLHHATYTKSGRTFHPTLSRAISALESKGYQVQVDLFTN